MQSDLKSEMANKPNLRLATFNVPMYCEIVAINGKQMIRGLKMFTNIVELFERAGFNVSLVPVGEMTSGVADANGTYNGLYGAVQSGVSLQIEIMIKSSEIFIKNADISIIGVPLRLLQSIGQFTPVIMDAGNLIMTKRKPVQILEGTLFDCLTTLGSLNNLLLGAIVALTTVSLIFLSILGSKRASWNFFAQLMIENFVHFRPMSLQLILILSLLLVRALFGSAYSTDVTVAVPPKLINNLKDLADSELLPFWTEGDPIYLEFQQGVTKTHADVFNMGPKNRAKIVSVLQFQQGDYSKLFETNSLLYFELLSSSMTKYVCKYKSSQICSGGFRMFISQPFSRTAFAYLYSKTTSASTADALKKYGSKFLEQSFFGNTFKTATDEFYAFSPQCENEIYKGVEAVESTNRVRTKLVPWFEMICALVAAMAVFLVEVQLGSVPFINSLRR